MERRDGQPDAILAALEALVDATVGVKLFTLMTFDAKAGEASRSYSNMPSAYPVSGKKPMSFGIWAETVLEGHRIFVANDIETIDGVFQDAELIRSLGCESCINIPVVIAGEVLGTLNCLHEAGHYAADRVAAAEALKLPGAIAFLTIRDAQDGEPA